MDLNKSALHGQPDCLSIKSGQVPFATLLLARLDLQAFSQELSQRVAVAPELLINAPVVIDFAKLPVSPEFFCQCVAYARELQLNVFAIRTVNESLSSSCKELGIANLGPSAVKHAPVPVSLPPTKIVRQVRSGQQVYARGASLVVFGHVSDGAEVVADGDVFIHGVLRGKAVAGASGNANAQIYCQQLQAQLLAVNGIYAVNDQIPLTTVDTVVRLQDGQLEFVDPQKL